MANFDPLFGSLLYRGGAHLLPNLWLILGLNLVHRMAQLWVAARLTLGHQQGGGPARSTGRGPHAAAGENTGGGDTGRNEANAARLQVWA